MLGRGCRGAPSEARDDWRYRTFWIVRLEGALLATPSADRLKGHSTAAGRQPRPELQAAPLSRPYPTIRTYKRLFDLGSGLVLDPEAPDRAHDPSRASPDPGGASSHRRAMP
jgi:hypothetical protein